MYIHSVIIHVQLTNGTREKFDMDFLLRSLCVCFNSEGSSETECFHMLGLTVASFICYEYNNIMSWTVSLSQVQRHVNHFH